MNTHICLVCGKQFDGYWAACPRCKYKAVHEKEKIANRLVKGVKFHGYFVMSICHLQPELCRWCGAEPMQTEKGYRTACSEPSCRIYSIWEDTWVWNAMSGEDASTVTIGLGGE